MTPLELLDEVCGRFVVLSHNEPSALERLLYQALAKFSDKAGVLYTVMTHETTICLPPFFWRVATCHDSAHRYVPTQPDRETGELHIGIEPNSKPPYTIHYLVKLEEWPRNRELPAGCISLVADYLEALIAIPNVTRSKDLRSAMDLSTEHMPSVQEIRARLAEVEMQMEDAKAILPPVAVY